MPEKPQKASATGLDQMRKRQAREVRRATATMGLIDQTERIARCWAAEKEGRRAEVHVDYYIYPDVAVRLYLAKDDSLAKTLRIMKKVRELGYGKGENKRFDQLSAVWRGVFKYKIPEDHQSVVCCLEVHAGESMVCRRVKVGEKQIPERITTTPARTEEIYKFVCEPVTNGAESAH